MKSFLSSRKQTASFGIANPMHTLVALLLMLSVVVPANGQTSGTAPSPADWTQFHRDNMQRWNPYVTVLGVNNVGDLQLKWRNSVAFNALSVGYTGLISSPAVVNGVVYFGSNDFNVYALNASTGAKLWSYTTGNVVETSPAVADGVVYIGSDDGNLYALNASMGSLLWSFFSEGELMESSASVANGVVYVSISGGVLYALNARTGAILWEDYIEDTISSPAVVSGVVYIGSADDNVYALNASTGAKLWSYTTGGEVDSSPAVANGVVYVGSNDGNVYALNANTGAKLWSFAAGATVLSSPAVANGVVYVSSYEGNVYGLNANSGAKLWSYVTGGYLNSSPAVANGVVYVSSDYANVSVYALNAGTGAKLWSYATKGYLYSSPTVANGAVYFNVGDYPSGGYTYAFSVGADLFLRIRPTPTTVHQGDLITYAFPVWNLGPGNAVQEVLKTQVPEGTTFDYIRISGTKGLGTCTTPPYEGSGEIVCHENSAMAPNTTWTVRVVVKVTAPAGTVITESATATEDTTDPNLANNTATVSMTVQ
jgi:outer membrane protein assembly factor BamB